MYPLRQDNIIAYAVGPQGPMGSVTPSDLDALKGGVATDGDTLKKLRDLIALRAPLDGAALTNATTPILANGANSTALASASFVQQEVTNYNVSVQSRLDYKVNNSQIDTEQGLTANSDGRVPSQKAVRAYVDALRTYTDLAVQGLDAKQSTKAATTGNITLSGAQTIDGVALVAGDRALVKNQTSAAQNGIYVVAAGTWVRSLDADAWSEIPGAYVFAEQGTINGDTGWVCNADQGGTLGTTAITFVQFAGAGTYTPGFGLGLSGTQFSVTDPELVAFAGVTSAADKLFYFTGSGTGALTNFTSFGRTLVASADAAAAKTALSLTQADIPFTGLTAAAAAADADTLPVNQGVANLKQTFGAIKTWIKSWIAKADVGLGNVDNTSDVNKPVSTAQAASIATKLPLAGGTLTGPLTLAADPTNALHAATKQYTDAAVNALIGANDVEVYKGVVDASANPNYPAADAGHVYRVSVAGKIGGASGVNVEIGDRIQCVVDGTVTGTQAAVGANWWITQANIDGAVVGPASSTSGNIATFSGTSGKVVADGGKALPSGAIVGLSDSQALTNKDLTGAGNTFPTLNQNTTGSAAKLTTARTIDGVSFDGTSNITVIAAAIHAATVKSTPVDADELGIADSAASYGLKKLTWANLKATLKTYFDALYDGLNKPAFSATRGGTNQTAIAPATFTKVQFTAEDFDTNNNFDNATNYRFQPSVAGKYAISAQIALLSIATGVMVICCLYKNGSALRFGRCVAGGTNTIPAQVTAIVDMNGSSDYLEIFAYHESGAGNNKDLSGASADTYVSASRIAT